MSTTIRGFQVNSVLDRLVWDLLNLLEDHLDEQRFDSEGLQLAVLVTLSRSAYVRSLLFRDYAAQADDQWHRIPMPDGSEERIHEQALVYFEKALSRRPALARKLMDTPGNMHLLLGTMCAFGAPDERWQSSSVERSRELSAKGADLAGPMALSLARLRKEIDGRINEISLQRRAQFGPVWLRADGIALELPEEMSLFEMFDALPHPVSSQAVADAGVQRLLNRVIDTLNERYTLLRSCGLNPQDWHDRDEPAIGRLRDLKRLRGDAEDRLRHGADNRAAAYRLAFEDLADARGAFAGCGSFDEFAATEWGQIILHQHTVALDAGGEGEEGERESMIERLADDTDVSAEVERSQDAGYRVAKLLDRMGDRIDDATRHVFVEVVARGRAFFGEGDDPGVLADSALRAAAEEDADLSALSDEDLAATLYERCEKLIRKGMVGRMAAA